jgi:hypothetical protein
MPSAPAPFHVQGGQATAQVVIVHRGQIVVDQRIGVQGFDRRRRRDGGFRRYSQHAGGFQHQKAAQAFAALNGIAHGVYDGLIGLVDQGRVQTGLDQAGIGSKGLRKGHIPSTGVVPMARPSAARISSTFSSASFNLPAQWDFNAAPRS